MNYQTKEVQDLAWTLRSPSLINESSLSCDVPTDEWYQSIYEDFKDNLTALDKSPEPLLDWISKRKNKRLGFYFESLWSFWLEKNGRYKKVLENEQIRSGKKTLGELDFIVYDTVTNEHIHWEVALKFYLAYGPSSELSSWFGLQANDKLEYKIDRLESHQSKLTSLEEAEIHLSSRNIEIQKTAVLVKGKLFYHRKMESHPSCINKNHLSGWWMELDDFKNCFFDQSFNWFALRKLDWLSPEFYVSNQSKYSFDKLQEVVEKFTFPICLIGYKEESIEIGFVTPNDWLGTLNL